MRIYVPIVTSELGMSDISERIVHAVTPELEQAVPNEDAEGYEMIATLAAADDSLRLIDAGGHNERRRALVVADVAPSMLEVVPDPDTLPTARRLTSRLAWTDVESIHIDEEGSEHVVERALAGDEDAFLESGDIELMWFDITERPHLATVF